jgi:hypothetical protein
MYFNTPYYDKQLERIKTLQKAVEYLNQSSVTQGISAASPQAMRSQMYTLLQIQQYLAQFQNKAAGIDTIIEHIHKNIGQSLSLYTQGLKQVLKQKSLSSADIYNFNSILAFIQAAHTQKLLPAEHLKQYAQMLAATLSERNQNPNLPKVSQILFFENQALGTYREILEEHYASTTEANLLNQVIPEKMYQVQDQILGLESTGKDKAPYYQSVYSQHHVTKAQQLLLRANQAQAQSLEELLVFKKLNSETIQSTIEKLSVVEKTLSLEDKTYLVMLKLLQGDKASFEKFVQEVMLKEAVAYDPQFHMQIATAYYNAGYRDEAVEHVNERCHSLNNPTPMYPLLFEYLNTQMQSGKTLKNGTVTMSQYALKPHRSRFAQIQALPSFEYYMHLPNRPFDKWFDRIHKNQLQLDKDPVANVPHHLSFLKGLYQLQKTMFKGESANVLNFETAKQADDDEDLRWGINLVWATHMHSVLQALGITPQSFMLLLNYKTDSRNNHGEDLKDPLNVVLKDMEHDAHKSALKDFVVFLRSQPRVLEIDKMIQTDSTYQHMDKFRKKATLEHGDGPNSSLFERPKGNLAAVKQLGQEWREYYAKHPKE